MIVYDVEPLTQELADECMDILIANNEETGIIEGEPANPAWDELLAIAQSLLFYTMRNEGILVGMCVFMTGVWSHHKHLIAATQLTLYVKPEYRTKSIRFLNYMDEDMKERGVNVSRMVFKE